MIYTQTACMDGVSNDNLEEAIRPLENPLDVISFEKDKSDECEYRILHHVRLRSPSRQSGGIAGETL